MPACAFEERTLKHILPEETYGFNSEVVWIDYVDVSEFRERHHYPGNPLPADTTVFQRCDSLQLIVRREFCRWEYLPTVLLMEAAEVDRIDPDDKTQCEEVLSNPGVSSGTSWSLRGTSGYTERNRRINLVRVVKTQLGFILRQA